MIVNLEARGVIDDLKIQRIARAIAMDIDDLSVILMAEGLSPEQMIKVSEMPYFQKLLRQATEEWHAIGSTAERIRIKSLHLVEQSLPEFYARMHDKAESLLHKTDTLKTIAKFAGVGVTVGAEGSADRVSVTINLSGDKSVRIDHARPAIEADYTETE